MRDPVRIRRISALLTAVWWACPDLRLGQIVETAKAFASADPMRMPTAFYVEDDIIEAGLKRWLEEINRVKQA
jgi:hypothetical protein